MNKECPICDRWFIDKKITAMNLDEPEFRGYCRPCRKKLKAQSSGNVSEVEK